MKNLTASKPKQSFWAVSENKIIQIIIVLCLPVLLYLQTVSFDFTYADDDDIIINNITFLSNLSNVPQAFLKDAFLEKNTPLYRPLQTLSYMTDIWLSGGNNPWMYHLTNILLLGLSACLLFLLLRKFSVPVNLALLSTLLYYSHPLFVSSVAWIPARGDLLLSFFAFLSFLLFVEFVKTGKNIYLIFNWLFFTAALFSKETAAVLPILFIIYYLFFSFQLPRKLKTSVLILTIFIYAISGIFWFWIRSVATGNASEESQVGLITFISNFRTIPESLSSFLFPFNIELIPAFSLFRTITGLVIIIVSLFIIKRLKEFNKQKIFWGIWFLLLSVPALFYKTEFYDYLNHRFFLPLVGILFFVALSVPKKWLEEKTIKISWLMVAIIIYNSTITFSKSRAYSDPLTYCNSCIAENPENALMYNNRGFIKDRMGDFQGAIADYSKAIELDPDFALVYYNRGNVFGAVGDLTKAIKDYDNAIKLQPDNPILFYNRGNAYQGKDSLLIAINDYSKAIELDENYLFAYNNRGLAFYNLGNPEMAVNDFNKVLELDPTFSVAYGNRGLAYSALGKYELAIKNYDKAIELDPYFADAYYNRAMELKNKGFLEKAARDLEKYKNLTSFNK